MVKRIKQWLEKKKQEKAKTAELQKIQKYYGYLQMGAHFIQFIQQDLNKKRQQSWNRAMRRRMEKDLQKGEISEEIVNHYKNEVDRILVEIDNRLKPAPKEKRIDGAAFYKQAQNLANKEKK
jgi:hypoxanthine phosphoribosyltransferase